MKRQIKKQMTVAAAMVLLALAGQAGSRAAVSSGQLEIYLPRQATADQEIIELGKVAVLRGSELLCEKAKALRLGQFALPGQVIRIDRTTLLSRLAAVGIESASVSITGAEMTSVCRDGRSVGGKNLVGLAQSFVEEQLKPQGLALAKPLQIPADRPRTTETPFEVVPTLEAGPIPGRRVVQLSIRENGKEIERVEIPFQVRFKISRPAAAVAIEAGSEIGPDAIRMEESEGLEPIRSPLVLTGMVAQRRIPAGAVILPQWLKEPTPPVLVARRQKVTLRIERGSLVITASGEALEDGRAGDVIRVKRGISPDERIVVGKVLADGSVEPVQ